MFYLSLNMLKKESIGAIPHLVNISCILGFRGKS